VVYRTVLWHLLKPEFSEWREFPKQAQHSKPYKKRQPDAKSSLNEWILLLKVLIIQWDYHDNLLF